VVAFRPLVAGFGLLDGFTVGLPLLETAHRAPQRARASIRAKERFTWQPEQ